MCFEGSKKIEEIAERGGHERDRDLVVKGIRRTTFFKRGPGYP